MVAEQDAGLLRIMLGEPAQQAHAFATRGDRIAVVVVEVIADRHQRDVIGEAIAGERLVTVEHLEHLRKRCLGIAHHERAHRDDHISDCNFDRIADTPCRRPDIPDRTARATMRDNTREIWRCDVK